MNPNQVPASNQKPIQRWADSLVCPVCIKTLIQAPDSFTCSVCGRTYPITNGIPILIANRTQSKSDD